MELKIISDSENKLIARREIEFYVLGDDSTPKKLDVKTALCKKLNLNPDSTLVVRISQSFGAKQSKALAHSYADPKALAKFEQSYLFERKGKKKKGEKKAEEPAEEKK